MKQDMVYVNVYSRPNASRLVDLSPRFIRNLGRRVMKTDYVIAKRD